MVNAMRQATWRDGAENGWHDDLIWYAAGIHRMRQRTPGLDDFYAVFNEARPRRYPRELVARMATIAQQWSDPASFGYQSQVHGTFLAAQAWPSHAGKRVLWQECAHNHWFFLPWHRAYLLEFEAVVREHIRALDGPADEWALPYWNYSDFQADTRRLGIPLPLRGATLPDGVEVPGVEADDDGSFPNPLFNPTRLGRDELDPALSDWANATDALLRPHYANQEDLGFISFGGGVLETPNVPALFHDQAEELGMLDAQPHGSTHMRVHGTMSRFETAALDPIFWLHHCNVDRLWETYAHDLQHGYPFQDGSGTGTAAHTSWTGQKFRFLRPDGSVHTWTAPQLLDVGKLGYGYDTTAPPPLPPAPEPPEGSDVGPFGIAVSGPVPEPVAEARSISLAEARDVPVTAGAGGDQGVGVGSFREGAKWALRFDGIRASAPAATSYRVFLGLQPGEDADPADVGHYAGLLSLFGVHEASRDDGSSAGNGQRRLLDVTAQVSAQAETLRPLETSVRLVPLDPDRELAEVDLTIERITLEFA